MRKNMYSSISLPSYTNISRLLGTGMRVYVLRVARSLSLSLSLGSVKPITLMFPHIIA